MWKLLADLSTPTVTFLSRCAAFRTSSLVCEKVSLLRMSLAGRVFGQGVSGACPDGPLEWTEPPHAPALVLANDLMSSALEAGRSSVVSYTVGCG